MFCDVPDGRVRCTWRYMHAGACACKNAALMMRMNRPRGESGAHAAARPGGGGPCHVPPFLRAPLHRFPRFARLRGAGKAPQNLKIKIKKGRRRRRRVIIRSRNKETNKERKGRRPWPGRDSASPAGGRGRRDEPSPWRPGRAGARAHREARRRGEAVQRPLPAARGGPQARHLGQGPWRAQHFCPFFFLLFLARMLRRLGV